MAILLPNLALKGFENGLVMDRLHTLDRFRCQLVVVKEGAREIASKRGKKEKNEYGFVSY